jgi:hypothetical protein
MDGWMNGWMGGWVDGWVGDDYISGDLNIVRFILLVLMFVVSIDGWVDRGMYVCM